MAHTPARSHVLRAVVSVSALAVTTSLLLTTPAGATPITAGGSAAKPTKPPKQGPTKDHDKNGHGRGGKSDDRDDAKVDTDGDGLKDKFERRILGTDPNRADTDGDGLDDGAEFRKHKTNPMALDTDGDGIDDRTEIVVDDTDPLDADDFSDPSTEDVVYEDDEADGDDDLYDDTP